MAVLFPRVQLLGIDLSGAMLERARRNLEGRLDQVDLCLGSYPGESDEFEWGVDAVVFSYALSMFNPGWEGALEAAAGELGEGGIVAVVDFHDTPWGGFRRWMGVNHVRMEGHLLARLRSDFDPIWEEERRAFGGLWRYFLFIGRRKALGDGGARG
jgi:S-adenosylmethionine-diacylgycerolhomoserine-N-methlytransferase